MATQIVYLFKDIPDLYADLNGNFFYKGKPTKKVYNNGSIAVLCGNTKRGIITLRKLAFKSTITIADCPF